MCQFALHSSLHHNSPFHCLFLPLNGFVQPLSLISFPPSLPPFLPASCRSGPPGSYSCPSNKRMGRSAKKRATNGSDGCLCSLWRSASNITLLETGCDCFIPGGVFHLSNGHYAQLEPQWSSSWDKAEHIPAGPASSLTVIAHGDQILLWDF